MPRQRIRSHAADFVNLGERRADTAGSQDRSDLQALLRRDPTGKKRDRMWYLDAAGGLSVGNQTRRACGKFDSAATISKLRRRGVANNGLGSRGGGKWTDIAGHREEHAAGASTAARTLGDFRRFLANSCRPTQSTLRHNNEIINMGFLNLTEYP